MSPRPRTLLHTESSRGWGGQEIRIVSEAFWLAQHGLRMILAAQPGSRILEEATRARLDTVPITMRGAWDLAAVLRLARLIRREAVEVVHTHSSVDAWVGGSAARLARVPVVRSRHVSIPIRGAFNPVYRCFADRVITSGDAIRDLVLARVGRPETVVAIPAGVDPREFAPGPPNDAVRREFGGATPIIGSIAMFRRSKGHDHLLAAFESLIPDWPRARLLLVGDGIRRRQLEELVSTRGLTARVLFAGFRRDVAEMLRLMDVSVLASTRTEGVPQSVLQAMAVGVPVVATAVGGIPEVVTDGVTGLLVPPGRPDQLATAIRAVLGDPAAARRRSEVARRLVETRYSRTRCLEDLLRLYAELLA